MKIYNTKTQSDYYDLMIELDEKGYLWSDGENLCLNNYFEDYGSKTTITKNSNNKKIRYSNVEWNKKKYPDIQIIEYKADKKQETNDFIKELTVKIYYNEITKKHYNSYDEAIADCKKEMERLYDKD